MTPLSDRIAQSSISLYETLPKHGKPSVRDNGVPEWTILSVISLVVRQPSTFDSDHSDVVIPVSLGTGVKVLPHQRLPPLGDAVHDCHGEVVARRGFVRWLIFQAALLDQKENGEIGQGPRALYVERGENGKLKLKDGVDVWLYVSALPVRIFLILSLFYAHLTSFRHILRSLIINSVEMPLPCIPQCTNLPRRPPNGQSHQFPKILQHHLRLHYSPLPTRCEVAIPTQLCQHYVPNLVDLIHPPQPPCHAPTRSLSGFVWDYKADC